MLHYLVLRHLLLITIALIFIVFSGIFLYMNENLPTEERNPLFFALGIAFASGGASIIFNMIVKTFPEHIHKEIIHK